MALELAVRSVSGSPQILEEQLARITNPDRKARFEFLMPAVSGNAEDRAAWFARLADVQQRRREPWVADGLRYLHHPLRAESAERFIRPALDLLEEIHRTGDIFFPRNWTEAVLSGHRSREAAGTVRRFLAERPDYPVRLRRVILQAADDLFRASSIAP
jgi:aminopeptidase N